jgi:hypothetical protein
VDAVLVDSVLVFLLQFAMFLVAIVVAVAGLASLHGRRARGIDHIADVAAASAARSVYPESLRGSSGADPLPSADRPRG